MKYRITIPPNPPVELELVDGVTVKAVAEPAPEPPPPSATYAVPQPNADGYIGLFKSGTYELDRDIGMPATAIYVANEDVTLNLNGYSVRGGLSGAGEIGTIEMYEDHSHNDIFGRRPRPYGFQLIGPGKVYSGEGAKSVSVGGERSRGHGMEVIGAQLFCSGVDSSCVRVKSGGFKVRKCVAVSDVSATANRHQTRGTIHSWNGRIVVEDSAIIGGLGGIKVIGGKGKEENGKGSKVRRCLISQDGAVTYAIQFYRTTGCTAEDNLIVPVNGRGVLLNAGFDHIVQNNTILAWDRISSHFGTAINACCVRSRYGSKNHIVQHNRMLAVGGADRLGASCLYLTDLPNGNNRFLNNDCTAVLRGASAWVDQYGKSITLEGHGKETNLANDVIDDNVFKSNHWNLSLAGRDSWETGAWQEPINRNKFFNGDASEWVAEFIRAVRNHPLATLEPETVAQVTGLLADITKDEAKQRSKWAHIYGGTYHSPAKITIRGSGTDLKQRIGPSAEKWPVEIILE